MRSGTDYPCAWCFQKTTGVIAQADYDVDETDGRMGVRLDGKPPLKSTAIVCAECLHKDHAQRAARTVPVTKKLLSEPSPATSALRKALRAGSLPEEDEDEEGAEEEARLVEKTLKPLEKLKKKSKKALEREPGIKKRGFMTTDPPGEAKESEAAKKKKRKW